MQCMLCGCKFDETKVKPCGCNCAFGGCNGENVRCPNCGHDMHIPKELRKDLTEDQQKSLLTRIINSLKSEN
ncbi:hypothetical protein NL43_05335 [Methanosphaera sp. WGK6]|nr:hypothetical protein NL43_05335 [Methanosphaera sp. WGK6]